jgi:hypothetical protein
MWPFKAPHVALKNSWPIPSLQDALLPSPLFTAPCSSSDVLGLSRASCHSSDKRRWPASTICLRHSSFTRMGLYFCLRKELKACAADLVLRVGYCPLLSPCPPFNKVEEEHPFFLKRFLVVRVDRPRSSLALHNFTSLAIRRFMAAICSAR